MTIDPIGMIGDAIRQHPDGCTLAVRVQPGAKKTAITGVYGEGAEARVKIALQAPAVEGRANEALIAFLADVFDLPRSAVTITHGQAGRSKLVSLQGMAMAEAKNNLRSRF